MSPYSLSDSGGMVQLVVIAILEMTLCWTVIANRGVNSASLCANSLRTLIAPKMACLAVLSCIRICSLMYQTHHDYP